MSTTTDFPLFPKLPAELRRRVWQLCIPTTRTVEISMPPNPDMVDDRCICYCRPEDTTRRNAAAPSFTQSCREAYEVALEEGGRLLLPSEQDVKRLPNHHASALLQNPWFWPARDTVHLNSDPQGLGWSERNELPLPLLLRSVQGAARCSLMSQLLGWPPLDDVVNEGGRLSGRFWMRRALVEARVLGHLRYQSAYSVCLMTVKIHARSHVVQESGLFEGGASPLQLVPTSDLQTFSAMHRLWVSSHDPQKRETIDEQTTRQFHILFDHEKLARRVAGWQQDLRERWLLQKYEAQWKADELLNIIRASAIVLRGELSADARVLSPDVVDLEGFEFDHFHPWVKAILDTMPTFHPVIMFRHCALECYSRAMSSVGDVAYL
ncbi:Glycoside catalytic domain protein [Diaporthe amygdali]|uniref:Glycoside catalytic domain protein n=1 Tax=Phomopsis amygdali TaxID=1214568 RepID=UPI0022FE2FC6|nr:Glycoside catalytic domain protein [Diaporthe amygdali]KAJ0115646.1 Glycoside catalytic domain protein [Diaporthe amygdali]